MVRNRCFNKRTRRTPYELITGKKPNVSKMQKFGSVCHTYKQDKGNFDSRCDRGRFVGNDKNRPAFLVYHPDVNKVQKHRLVKFVSKAVAEKQTQTGVPDLSDGYGGVKPKTDETTQSKSTENAPEPSVQSGSTHSDSQGEATRSSDHNQTQQNVTDGELESRRQGNSGGRWVYSIKTDAEGKDRYKARFVAKGYNQRMGIDYGETFSPTADLTSVRVVLQKAAQENLLLHQMDVKTAYLHAPIDYEICINPPEGYQEKEGIVYKLEKSLYGLKQSGPNWNKILHDCLS
ncbi:uncharacterized protein LOC102082235 isoform X1 [Tachysurus ichikawai]